MADLPKQRINAELIYYRLDEIKSSIDEIKKDYVTTKEFEEKIGDLEMRINEARKSGLVKIMTYTIVTTIITAIITYEASKLFRS